MPPEAEENRAVDPPEDVRAIRQELRRFLDTLDDAGRKIGSYQWGVYAFYDYDAEPIYVGQSVESLRGRISRHLTNQRTDAVAMNVLDPFEVAEVEVWPLALETTASELRKQHVNRAEATVFTQVLAASRLGAVLNEKPIPTADPLPLPPSYRGRIIPANLYAQRRHPDVRLARRASTIANLARVISERGVSRGLRKTLLTQARRLELLARQRLADFEG